MNVILCDDVIQYQAQKSSRAPGQRLKTIKLSREWRNHCVINRDNSGKRIIEGYWNGKIGNEAKSISVKDYDELSEKEQLFYKPKFEYAVAGTDRGNKIIIRSNQFIIRLYNLSKTEARIFMSRYNKCLSLLVENKGLFDYEKRSGASQDEKDVIRSHREAIRNKLTRRFKVNKYEFNIMFVNKELGLAVKEELLSLKDSKGFTVIGEPGSETIYLQGYDKKGKCENVGVKFYDMGKKHKEYVIGSYKLEVTFGNKKIDDMGIKINDLKSQEESVKMFLLEVLKVLEKYKGVSMNMLKDHFIRERENILARVIRLENKSDELENKTDELELMQKRNKEVQDRIMEKLQELDDKVSKTK